MLSLLKRNSVGARLWISDQRPDDYRREVSKVYDTLEKLFEIERNFLLVPVLISVLLAVISFIAFPPAMSSGGWQMSFGVGAGVMLAGFTLAAVVIRFCSRGAHQKVLEELQLRAAQKRVQTMIKLLGDHDRSIRPLIRKYHLTEERRPDGERRPTLRPGTLKRTNR